MTSNTTTGERRWASARRGGMTVLGKVAVPKPINLPSQRLENHGLDPNVEIVPKGTLSWGSRSSAGSNVWGTSALSPSTDGSSSSPSQLAGRPSSGGGSRPSTAGSEIAHDSNVNAWSSHSRPSSASGSSASNNVSLTSLRPRSAETRPGSSQLSRFAEPSPESSGGWGSSATSERIGLGNSGKDGFSLSSGDFPTLGSEKDESRKNTEPPDHASNRNPDLSSGVTTIKESIEITYRDDISRNADSRGSSWRKDGPSYVEDGPRPSMERCYGEPHHQNPNMSPHYESWRGASPCNPVGPVWYRGPPGPPPYGAPNAPGGFPMEPFPYYPPQVPAPGLANSQAVPPRGAGPHGHYSTNGDMYRPHMSDSYMRPGMPIRPGFYPGPVHYEGYYGPPMRFCNPSDRDLSFMGMPTGPPVYNRPVNPNVPDLKHSHSRPGEAGAPEQLEPCNPHNPRGNSNALRKQNDRWNLNDEQRWGYKGTNVSNHEKGILSKASIQDNAWGDDYKKDEDMHDENNVPVEKAPQSIENKFVSSNPANVMFPGGVSNLEDTDLGSVTEIMASTVDHSLMQKIEGLNAKARSPGGRQDAFYSDEQRDGMKSVNAKANQSANDANSDIVLERHYPSGVLVPVSHDTHIAPLDKSREIMVPSRKLARGAQSRGNHGKGSFNGQEADGWRKRSESHAVVTPSGSEPDIKNQVVEHDAVVHPAEASEPNVRKGDEESVLHVFDPSDAQQAKMKERAKQRAIQLQKEEEERIRDQKAKALAKLEELNRRSVNQAAENPGHKVDTAPLHNAAPLKQEGPRNHVEPRFDGNRSTKSTSASAINFVSANERGAGDTVSSIQVGAETEKTAGRDSTLSQNQLPAADVNVDNDADQRPATQVHESSRQKRVGNKQRQNISREKNSTLETIPVSKTDIVKDHKDSAGCEVAGDEVSSGAGRELAESPHMLVPPVHQKKKNKSGKNKNKVEELPTGVSLSRAVAESNNAEATPATEELSPSSLNVNSSSIQSSAAKDVTHTCENHSTLSHEDAHSRQNNAWKPQHSRKAKNSQGNRSSEKFHNNDAVVWAPVRLHNKVEATDRTSQKAAESLAPSVTGDNLVNNNPKTKRAEMERYVPKPVAKELEQQGSIQQSRSPPVDQAATDGTGGMVKPSQGSDYLAEAGSSVKSKHVDGKHRQRAQGSWCQRGYAESDPVQVSQDSSSAAVVTGKNIETRNGSGKTVKSDETLVGGPPSISDHEFLMKGPKISDGWSIANDSGFSSSAAFAGGKDNVPSGRGKRHTCKGHKGTNSNLNFDSKDLKTGLTDLQHHPIETSQTERTVPSKENRAVGDRAMSHWQPKAQGSVAHNQQGDKSHSHQNLVVEESCKAMKRDTSNSGDSNNLSQYNQGAARDPIASEGKDVCGLSSLRHQEKKTDKSVSVRGRAYSSNQGSVGEVASGPLNAAEGHDEQRPSSGYQKSANYGGHFSKGPESRGDWNSTVQENQKHYSSGNRERQRPNAHLEYQPVDPYNRSSDRPNDYGPQTENQPGGTKFRGRGQSHARRGRGNFYGRQRGNLADAVNE